MGRYWDLLRLLEDEGVVSEHTGEHREAWMAVVSEAVRREDAFRRFCREVGTFQRLPKDPDFRLLMGIKGLIEGGSPSAGEILDLKGLTPAAERLRAKFTAGAASSSAGVEKLRNLLGKFIRAPDKITERYYEQVADLLPVGPLGERVRYMGESIPMARRFNGKAAVARGWARVDMVHLEILDNKLLVISRLLPEALRDVLLHPFVHNIAVMCRRLAPDIDVDRAARLTGAIPFLLPRLAGEKLQEVERKLLTACGDWMSGDGVSPEEVGRKVLLLSLEEKVALLKGLRGTVQERAAEEPDDEDTHFFDDDFDDDGDDEDDRWAGDEFLQEKKLKNQYLVQSLLILYESVFDDISRRLSDLSPRERKELVRVMEPILLGDLDFLFATIENIEEFLHFLNVAIVAGCAGTRFGLFTLLAAACYRDRDLRKRAEKHLELSSPPTDEDMDWLATEWSVLYYPTVRSLKPLLVRYRNEKKLLAAFPAKLCEMLEFAFFEYVLDTEISKSPLAPAGPINKPDRPEEPGIVRRELVELAEFEVLDVVRYFMKCHPDDRLTMDGHLCWFEALKTFGPQAPWTAVLKEIGVYGKMKKNLPPFMLEETFGTLFTDRIEAVLLFMKGNIEDLATLSMDILSPLLDELLKHSKILPAHYTLLIRLEKLLAARDEAGEEAARPLRNKIKQTLQKLSKPEKKLQKPRKKKR